jgi:hypothetical protein
MLMQAPATPAAFLLAGMEGISAPFLPSANLSTPESTNSYGPKAADPEYFARNLLSGKIFGAPSSRSARRFAPACRAGCGNGDGIRAG